MKTLVLVDFDHTLYRKDSLIEFTKFYKGNLNFYIGILILLPHLLRWKLGIITNQEAKIKYITHFFKEENYEIFLKRGTQFAQEKIDKDLDNTLFQLIENHLSESATIYIVTASFPEWISAWANSLKINVIGTKLEVIDSKITGNFASKNCYGVEKVSRIKSEINLKDFEKIKVYGNGKGDLEMLKLAK